MNFFGSMYNAVCALWILCLRGLFRWFVFGELVVVRFEFVGCLCFGFMGFCFGFGFW